MRKLMALVLVVVMAMALAITVSAAGETYDGTITVEDTVDGQTYTLYKLFDATIVEGREGDANNGISYTLPSGKTLADDNPWFTVENGFVVLKAGADITSDPDAFRTWAENFGTANATTLTGDGDDQSWTGLTSGYYYITTTTGSLVTVTSIMPDVVVQDKNNPPSIDKEIVSTTSGVVGDEPANASDADEGSNEAATAQVGDTVTYKITVSAKPGAENYIVTDTLSNGLTPCAATGVTVTGATVTTDYSVDVDGQTITVTFTKAYLDKITTDTDIVINYTAVVNNGAVIGEEGNGNTAKLQYGHTPTSSITPGSETPPDKANVYVAKISVTKTDGTDGLAGAEFALKNADDKYYSVDTSTGAVSWVDTVDSATKYTSGDDGKLSGDFTGLSNGVYTLEEVVVPNGYNPIAPDDPSLTITIEDDDYTNANLIQSATVVNNSGIELPSTGGIGTKIFYTMGAVLVIGAGVMMVSKKRAGE